MEIIPFSKDSIHLFLSVIWAHHQSGQCCRFWRLRFPTSPKKLNLRDIFISSSTFSSGCFHLGFQFKCGVVRRLASGTFTFVPLYRRSTYLVAEIHRCLCPSANAFGQRQPYDLSLVLLLSLTPNSSSLLVALWHAFLFFNISSSVSHLPWKSWS